MAAVGEHCVGNCTHLDELIAHYQLTAVIMNAAQSQKAGTRPATSRKPSSGKRRSASKSRPRAKRMTDIEYTTLQAENHLTRTSISSTRIARMLAVRHIEQETRVQEERLARIRARRDFRARQQVQNGSTSHASQRSTKKAVRRMSTQVEEKRVPINPKKPTKAVR